MTVKNASRHTNARGTLNKRAIVIGLSAGLYAALGAVGAAEPAKSVTAVSVPGTAGPTVDPAKVSPGAVQVSGIDFKRGEGGACLLYTSPSPRDEGEPRMPSSA